MNIQTAVCDTGGGNLNNLGMRTISTFEYLQSHKTKAMPIITFKSQRAHSVMNECERHVTFARANPEEERSEEEWEENEAHCESRLTQLPAMPRRPTLLHWNLIGMVQLLG